MECKYIKGLGLIGLGAGVLLILTGFLMTPSFVASHFSPDGVLTEITIQRVQVLRLLAVCIGILVVVSGASSLIYSSRVNRVFYFVLRLGDWKKTACGKKIMGILKHWNLPVVQSNLWILILALALLSTVSLRIAGIVEKQTIEHDEGITYLSATGHQYEYSQLMNQEQRPFGVWVEAYEWKRLWAVEDRFCFNQISSDLVRSDIHPPLYFWLLHIWSLVFGIHLWTGPSLNTLLALITALFLFGFARYTLGDSRQAAIVTLIWGLSPAVISISLMARQYDLLALCTIPFVWQVIRWTKLSKSFQLREAITLAILASAGVLTSYYFSLIILGSSLFLVVKLIKKNWRRLMGGLFFIGTGCGTLFLLHPGFYHSFSRVTRQSQPFDYSGVIPRIEQVLDSFLAFFGLDLSMTLLLILAASILALAVWLFMKYSDDVAVIHILYFLLWIAGTTIFLYLTFLTPRHAMGARYLSTVWPFFAFIPLLVLRLFRSRKLKVSLMVLLCIGLLWGSLLMLMRQDNWIDTKYDASHVVETSDLVIVDTVARGNLPRILWHVPHDKLVLAAGQDYLLGHPDLWLSRLDVTTVYISVLGYGNTNEGRQQIINLIDKRHEIIPVKGRIKGPGNAFLIMPAGEDFSELPNIQPMLACERL